MRLFVLICVVLWPTLTSQAQERIRNVRLRVADSAQLDISYDLVFARPGDSIYLAVKSRLRGSLRVLPEFVQGDVGKGIAVGPGRHILWNALANGYSLNEEVRASVMVRSGLSVATSPPQQTAQPVIADAPPKPTAMPGRTKPAATATPEVLKPAVITRSDADVATTPGPAPARAPTEPVPAARQNKPPLPPTVITDALPAPQKTRYAGPAWALLSAVAPGFGNIFVQQIKPRIGFRPLLAVGCYGLLVYGLQQRRQSRVAYAVYEGQKNAETAEPYYQIANDHHHRYYLATRGAIAVAAADVILTFFRGMRNVKIQAANRPLQAALSFRPGLQAGQPTAVMRYSF